jgi:uncharacterized protein DUF3192
VRISGPFDQARPPGLQPKFDLFRHRKQHFFGLTAAGFPEENAEHMNRWLVCLLLSVSCSASSQRVSEQLSLDQLASSNQAKLMRMSPGMQKEEVVALMGTTTAKTRDGIVNNPWTAEGFADKDGSRYEVLYYVTSKNLPFTPVRKSLTTPVVLKDNKVVGWGNDALDRILGGKTEQRDNLPPKPTR